MYRRARKTCISFPAVPIAKRLLPLFILPLTVGMTEHAPTRKAMEKQYTFPYRQYTLPDGATPEERLLIEEARKAAQGAYAPFSGYRVGAAARLASGRIITAANQESEVFPAGLCAERVLLFSHLATDPEDRITALAIASVPDDTECCPCGGCRQVMLDTMRRQGTPFRIIMSSGQSATVVDSPACLMPFPFGL